jgi:hypothetical protein
MVAGHCVRLCFQYSFAARRRVGVEGLFVGVAAGFLFAFGVFAFAGACAADLFVLGRVGAEEAPDAAANACVDVADGDRLVFD